MAALAAALGLPVRRDRRAGGGRGGGGRGPAGARTTRCRCRPRRARPEPAQRRRRHRDHRPRRRADPRRRGAGALHQSDPQEGAEGGRGLRLSRPYRVSRASLRRAAAGDDAGGARPARGAGDHPHPARRGALRADRRPAGGDAADHPRGAHRRLRHRRAAHRRRRAEPACRRGRRDGTRGDRGDRAGARPAAARGDAALRPALRRHAVPPGGARPLRRGGLHVPRPGADPAEDARFRRRGERDAGARLSCAPRPTHGTAYRHRRTQSSARQHRPPSLDRARCAHARCGMARAAAEGRATRR